jgi:hypothetical protein
MSDTICSATASASRPACPVTEALELQSQRLALRRLERNPLDELLERERRRRQRGDVDVAAQAEEVAIAGTQIERQVSALLEDPQLPHSFARHSARRDVRDGTRVEGEPRIRDVDERCEHRYTDRAHR